MIVELRAVPDCPNLDATRELLHTCLAEAGVAVAVTERIGPYPSPSVLIDGRDVTGADVHGPAACVLRPPTADEIRAALRETMTGSDTGAFADAVRADRPVRAAQVPSGVRAVHRHVLRHFAETGTPPTPAELAGFASTAGVDPDSALRLLAEADLLAVDEAGRLVAAYPFAPNPTAHVVEVAGVRTYAMCAIDALGVPAMLERDATITSADPRTGQPVTVTFTDGVAEFVPDTTVVVYAATGGGGRSVDTCCSTINFFADPASADAWIGAHPGLTFTLLDQDGAVRLGRDIFGPLLAEPDRPRSDPVR